MIERWMTLVQLVVGQTADPAAAPGTSPAGPAAPPSALNMLFFPALIVAMFVFLMVMQRGQQKRAAERKNSMLNNLAKNDRVLTIGGIIGTVAAVRDNEVVLKVDETTNAKMVFLKRAIQQVIKDDEEPKLDERP